MSRNDSVVITGMGIVSPIGNDLDTFWENCKNGRSGVSKLDRFNEMDFRCQVAGIVKAFDYVEDNYTYDKHIQYAMVAAEQAVKNSGLDISMEEKDNIGVSIATAIAGTAYMENEFIRMRSATGEEPKNENQGRNLLINSHFSTSASEIARKYGLFGPVYTLSTGCTAGLDALGAAIDLIKSGRCEVVIAGATEAPITPIAFAAFDIIGAMTSKSNSDPSTASKPYDKTRSGFVLGEGCGVFVLESKRHAEERKANILAEISGMASTCNAYHMTNLDKEGIDLHRAMKLSLEDAGISASEVDYINAHGSSTQQNDINETNAIKKTFGDNAYNIAISSVKSIVGHALAAANMIECVAAVLSLINKETTPSMNIDVPDDDCDLNYVGNEKIKINTVMKNASGFSGIHSAVIFKSLSGK